MPNLRVAIAGAGYISEFHLKGWAAQKDVEVVGISDPDLDRAKARATEFAIPQVFQDTALMLDTLSPDAIDIITPVETHGPLARLAADRGVHVMCQKPMAPTLQEAEALVTDIGERVRFMVHENYRFRPHYAEIARRVKSGDVGTPRQARLVVRASSLFDYPGKVAFLLGRQPYLKTFKRLLVFEVLIHHLDALRAIFGELDVTSASFGQMNPELSGEDVALITLQSHAGATLQIDANISALGYPPLPTDRLEIFGDADSLVFDQTRIFPMSRPEDVMHFDLQKNYQVCFTAAVSEFVSGLRSGRTFATDRLDNLETFRLMDAIYQIGAQSRSE